MTCKDCIHYDVCEDNLKYIQERFLKGLTFGKSEFIDGEFCNLFKDKSRIIELPLSIDDRKKIEKAMDSLYLYRLFPIECCEKCPKFQKEKNTCCQELCDVYNGTSDRYVKDDDWSYMCDNCPLDIEITEFTLKRYEEAVKLKQGKIEYQVKDLICFLTKEEAEAKLKELNDE